MTQTASPSALVRILDARRAAPRVVGPYGRAATGLAMQVDPQGPGFHLVLVNGARALMSLGPYAEEDVVAEWRSLGDKTGLPLMVRLANGATLTLMPQIGPVRVGPAEPAYRKGIVGGRRPRFLASRKIGRGPVPAFDPREGQGG
ncbi:DUF6101 family protein [Microvirga antarctica]|uniref:DUF6101 family protein n=1 Tax=Microvirga antarctica TaxID=2819233 RepID=UPI001B31594A|nr:DUF6101 family protein [Microvirga antarctica]